MYALNRLLVAQGKVKAASAKGDVKKVSVWKLEAKRSSSVCVEQLRFFRSSVQEKHPSASETLEELLQVLNGIVTETVNNVLMDVSCAF